jgi:hypothetical protein
MLVYVCALVCVSASSCPYVLLTNGIKQSNKYIQNVLSQSTGLFELDGHSHQDDDNPNRNSIPSFKQLDVSSGKPLIFCWNGIAKSWVVARSQRSHTFLLAAKLETSLQGRARRHAKFHPESIPASVHWIAFTANGLSTVTGRTRVQCLQDATKQTLCKHGFQVGDNCDKDHNVNFINKLPVLWPWWPPKKGVLKPLEAGKTSGCHTVVLGGMHDR